MTMLLPEGVPSLDAYRQHVVSGELAAMKEYSGAFAAAHPDLVANDPLDQWSRRWEYPFVFEAVRDHVAGAGTRPLRVLDAGSGFTYFPFFLAHTLSVSVTCADASPTSRQVFDRAARGGDQVEFRQVDLTVPGALKELAPFDAVVCVSVLEHVRARHRASMLGELHDLLRPGGIFVLTFDIAISGDYEIPVGDAEAILEVLDATFPSSTVSCLGVLSDVVRGDVVTTRRVAAREPERMPWRGRLAGTLGSLRHGFLPRSFGYPNLTFWCGRLVRHAEPSSARGDV